jgi:ATP-dependent helicase/nuclease subunit B
MKDRPQSAFFFDLSPPRYFSIVSGRPFLSDLAAGLITAFGDDLPNAEIYLPTRRAARALADAILDARASAGARAALLPRMRAIGDIDEDELAGFTGDAEDELALDPAISGTARLIALARLVAAKERTFAGQENWPAALAAARELGKLLDSLYAEEVDPARLDDIDVGDRAEHWRKSAEFLQIVTKAWPAFLAEQGLSDPAWRRAQLINAKAKRIMAEPPAHPVLIAGTTASAPAVARLVAAIAAAPRGAAILPGLDHGLDPAGFDAIEDAHPQFGLKRLLEGIGRAPSDIALWPGSQRSSPRAGLLRLALRPANATSEWRKLIDEATGADPRLAAAREGLTLIEAETEDAEASIIAMIFRETLETEGATAMLVTPDRNLARRVALKMRRWDVSVDDSGGVPFPNSPCGVFLRLVAGFLTDPGDPVGVLALLSHPLARLGLDEAQRRRGVEALDRALRGPRRGDAIAAIALSERRTLRPNEALLSVAAVLNIAAEGFNSSAMDEFAAMMRAHLRAAEIIAGGKGLWSGDDGALGAELFADLLAEERTLNALSGARYGDVFDELISGAVVRRRSDAHPRLSILGPLEARLMSAHHVILGGLNEGVWPQIAPADPFLSRTMRENIGLPAPERRIGLAAHDFAQGAAAAHVTLTRAKRAGGDPAKPSRWIVRLRNILDGAGALADADKSEEQGARAAALDAAGPAQPAEPPRPRGGPDRRPATLPVTDIERWIRDPYAVYAKRILRLRALEQPGASAGPREVGSLLHRLFERAAREPSAPSIEMLRAILDEEAPRHGISGADRAFWETAFEEAITWFAAFDAGRREKGKAYVEKKGEWTLPDVDPPFTLTARADRIEVLEAGGAAIFDYKTSALPTEKQEKTNFSAQLPLTGAILSAAGFDGIPAMETREYRYLKLIGRSGDDEKDAFGHEGDDARTAIKEAEAGLRGWIALFDKPDAVWRSKPRAQFIKKSSRGDGDLEADYDQLARRREWMASDDADGDGE